MKPAVNYVDVSLSQYDEKLVDYCNWNGLLVLASKPTSVDTSRLVLVQDIAREHATTTGNVLLSWHSRCLQNLYVGSTY